jgi:hypothetical protein
MSDDGDYAHCMREELGRAYPLSSGSGTYGHKLHGDPASAARATAQRLAGMIPDPAMLDFTGYLRRQEVAADTFDFYRADLKGPWVYHTPEGRLPGKADRYPGR